jgi:adenylate cyclase
MIVFYAVLYLKSLLFPIANFPSTMSKCDDLQYWLLTAGRHVGSFQNLLEEYACRLLEAGIPVDRVFIATRALHPQAAGFHLKWDRSPNGREDDKYEEFEAVYPADKDVEAFDWESMGGMPPFAQLKIRRVPQVRSRVEAGDQIPADCKWLIDGKYTDYIALPDIYGKNKALDAAYAWSTKIPGGFTPAHIEYFREHMPALSTVVRLHSDDRVTKTILVTYLGRGPGSSIHAGSIQQGDGVTKRSVLWFSDIRNFTAMSNRLPRSTVLQIINTVFLISRIL